MDSKVGQENSGNIRYLKMRRFAAKVFEWASYKGLYKVDA